MTVTVAAVVAAAGCAPARPGQRHPSASTTATAGPGNANQDAHEHNGERAGPTATTTVPPQAVQAAVAFVAAWARPDLDQATWLAGVTPHAMPEYATVLASVDPTHVPARRVTGPATRRTATPHAADVDVPTDAGPIRVVLVLRDGRWLIADLRPANGTP